MIIEDKKVSLLGIFIWLLASFFFLYEFFLRTLIGSVADQIMDDLTLSVSAFSWITSAYYFSYAAMQVPVGMLLDKIGVRKILIFATSICAISSICLAHSSGVISAFLSRLLMGFGSSFGFVSLLVVASSWFPRRYIGIISGFSQFIGTLGPILAGGPIIKLLMDSDLSWQRLMDLIGFVGFAMVMIMFILIRNKKRNGKSVTIYLREERPFQDYLKTLSKNPQVWFIAIYSGLIYIPLTLLGGAWGIPYIKSMGFSTQEAANVISLMWIGYAIGALFVGSISDRISRRRPILIFSALVSMMLVLAMILASQQSLLYYSVLFALLGCVIAGQTVAFSTIAEHVDFATKATAMGINNMSVTLLSSVSPIIAGYLINFSYQRQPITLIPSDFVNGFMLMPVLSAIGAIIAIFFIKETFCKFQKDPVFLKVDYNANTANG